MGILASGCRKCVTWDHVRWVSMNTGGAVPARALCQGYRSRGAGQGWEATHPCVWWHSDTKTSSGVPSHAALPSPQPQEKEAFPGRRTQRTQRGPVCLPVCPCPCDPRVAVGIPWVPAPGTEPAGTDLGTAACGSRQGEEQLRQFCVRKETPQCERGSCRESHSTDPGRDSSQSSARTAKG